MGNTRNLNWEFLIRMNNIGPMDYSRLKISLSEWISSPLYINRLFDFFLDLSIILFFSFIFFFSIYFIFFVFLILFFYIF